LSAEIDSTSYPAPESKSIILQISSLSILTFFQKNCRPLVRAAEPDLGFSVCSIRYSAKPGCGRVTLGENGAYDPYSAHSGKNYADR